MYEKGQSICCINGYDTLLEQVSDDRFWLQPDNEVSVDFVQQKAEVVDPFN